MCGREKLRCGGWIGVDFRGDLVWWGGGEGEDDVGGEEKEGG